MQVCSSSLQKQNASFFLSQITSSFAYIESVAIAYNFCKWSALILALVATVRSIITTVKIFIIRFRHNNSPSLSSFPLLRDLDYDDDDGDYSDTDDHVGTSSSDSEGDADEATADSKLKRVDEYFGVRGSGHHIDDQLNTGTRTGGILRFSSIGEIFSLSEIVNSKSVVKLWDSIGFGLGLDFDDCNSSPRSVISAYDVNDEQRICHFPAGKEPTPAISHELPAVLVSAGENASGNLALEIWDTRIRRRLPAVIAEWGPSQGKTVGMESGGVQKVYVRDDGRFGFTVGDM